MQGVVVHAGTPEKPTMTTPSSVAEKAPHDRCLNSFTNLCHSCCRLHRPFPRFAKRQMAEKTARQLYCLTTAAHQMLQLQAPAWKPSKMPSSRQHLFGGDLCCCQ